MASEEDDWGDFGGAATSASPQLAVPAQATPSAFAAFKAAPTAAPSTAPSFAAFQVGPRVECRTHSIMHASTVSGCAAVRMRHMLRAVAKTHDVNYVATYGIRVAVALSVLFS